MSATQTYVLLDAQGQVLQLARGEAPPAPGWLPADPADPAVREFLSGLDAADNPLAHTDASLARITEDLINVLIDKGMLKFTDLPQAAQAKLLARRQAREQLSARLQLLDDQDLI
ncbi:MAG: hypothetical protein VW339_07415 [Quisquiliibacterium sp.]